MAKLNKNDLLASLRVLDGSELSPGYKDIGFFEVDRRVFAKQYDTLSEYELGSSRLSMQWFQRNPSIYTVLMSGDKVVGYCNIMPLCEGAFESLMNGALADGEISAQMIERFDFAGPYRVYCCGVAILGEYRLGGLALRMMLTAIVSKYRALAARGCWISDLSAVAWNEQGRALCEGLGLQLVRAHEAHGDVYHARVASEASSPRRSVLRRLARTYENS
jgi:hypothetical protein